MGRFITADDIVQNPYDPQTLNRYSYVGNNPVNHVDPTGHFFKKLWKAISGFVAAAVGTLVGAVTANPVLGLTVYSAISSSSQSGNFGNNFGVAMLGGVVGLGVGAGIGAAWSGSFLSGLTAASLSGAAASAATTAVTGGNVGMGALAGFAGGSIGFVGGHVWSLGADAIAGGVASEIMGGKFGDGAAQGALHNLGNTVGGLMAPMQTLGQQQVEAGDAVYLKPEGPISMLISLFEGGVFAHTGTMVSDTEMVQSSLGDGGIKPVEATRYKNRGAYVSQRFRGNQRVINAAKALAVQSPKISYGFGHGQKVCSTCNAVAFNRGGQRGWYGIGPNSQAMEMGYSQFGITRIYAK